MPPYLRWWIRAPPSSSRPNLKRKHDSDDEPKMAYHHANTATKQFLMAPSAPYRKASQRLSGRAKADIDEFLSSDIERELELSFASTMSITSPVMSPVSSAPEDDHPDYVPMDISPAPVRSNQFFAQQPKESETKLKIGRPRALTSSSRLFGRDRSNSASSSPNPLASNKSTNSGTSGASKKLQRSALPFEWMATTGPSAADSSENMFAPPPQHDYPSPDASDAMDVDTSYVHVPSTSAPESPAPISAAPTITAFNTETRLDPSSRPLSAAPTVGFKNPFLDSMFSDNVSRGHTFEDAPSSFSIDESPVQPFQKKRRSASPEREDLDMSHHLVEDPSSPGLFASPSVDKLKRMSSASLLTNMLKKPLMGDLALNANNKRPRRPTVSAIVAPADAPQIYSAHPGHGKEFQEKAAVPRPTLPPVRRAFSAMLPPSMMDLSLESEDGSFDPDMSSPAQAYAKRQQVKAIRRCDGTDDFRSWTGASALVQRDGDVKKGLRRSEDRAEHYTPTERETPRSKYLNANGLGLGNFGDNEAHGKILPCHRVKEDGLMRISVKTLDDLLDGAFDSQITSFQVIDCRFDYEYNGGHVPGAININTPAAVEEFLLGSDVSKPKPSTSGDPQKKSILIFHCEFSAKRAPTFAKHLRSKDRALNNHVYPKVHYPEVYILEGGYCQYFKLSGNRCEPRGYVQMDDPHYAASRKEDLDQFRKAKFGRTRSYAYGDGKMSLGAQLQQPKRNSAPTGSTTLFAAGNVARSRRTNSLLQTLEEDSITQHSEDEDTDIGDSPCPPPNKGVAFKGGKIGRAPLTRAETYGPSRFGMGF
ncbi:hypothetical protein QCA50_007848 [Cerrena zonata]|uniref:M-phase inducer phosphatase n=1 Tax=Cerrena zonata TaxID=2478898 RepID=A0AAW0GGS7_9APHY